MTISRVGFLAVVVVTASFNSLCDLAVANTIMGQFWGHSILWVCLGIGTYHLTSDYRCVSLKNLSFGMPTLLGGAALVSVHFAAL
jgi:hypothetical protein